MKKKKIFLSTVFIFLIIFFVSSQTYNLQLNGFIEKRASPPPFKIGSVDVIKDGLSIKRYYTQDYAGTNIDIIINETILISSLTTLQLKEQSIIGNFPPACESMNNSSILNLNQAIQSTLSVYGCGSNYLTVNLIPNITIQSNGLGDICIGDQLSLSAFPIGFPSVAYNWQYSTDNGSNWIDLPAGFNNNGNISATMAEVIGSNHMSFLGTDILFRVGRNIQGAYSNDIISVNYSSCAPLVSSINYSPPNCTGDSVSAVVNLNRALETGETFSQIEIINASDSTQILAQASDVSTDAPNGTTFTFNNVSELEEGVSYKIRYQMKQDGVTVLGFIESVQTFTFNDATPVTFDASWTPAVNCFGDNTGTISITAAGGDGNYEYSINDGTNWFPFSNANTHSVTNLIAGNYQVKVKDTNCIAQQ